MLVRRRSKSGVAKSTIQYIPEKNEWTGQLSNTTRPERPEKRNEDHKILSLANKNNLTTSNQVKNSFKEIGASLSKSTIKTSLPEWQYRGLQQCKPLLPLKQDQIDWRGKV